MQVPDLPLRRIDLLLLLVLVLIGYVLLEAGHDLLVLPLSHKLQVRCQLCELLEQNNECAAFPKMIRSRCSTAMKQCNLYLRKLAKRKNAAYNLCVGGCLKVVRA